MVSSRVSAPARRTRAGAVQPVLELDPGTERPQGALRHRATAHERSVGLLDLEARMGEPVGQLSVVGEQDQPRRVDVEAPHRIQPQLAGYE